MIDITQHAKDLILKGKKLNNPELIQMGMNLLNQYQPNIIEEEEKYVCANCGYTMAVDKPRKRCPQCKKHQLQKTQSAPQKPDTEQFSTQIRQPEKSRVHYDDAGNPDGVIRRIEKIDISQIRNEWVDDGKYGHDKANEILKKFTKFTPRTRQSPKKVQAICEKCGRTFKLHPIHVNSRSQYICDQCIRHTRRT